MLQCGVYKHANGTFWNVIGVSGNTENHDPALVLQQLNHERRGQLVHLRISDSARAWVSKLNCVKQLGGPSIYGIPSSRQGWPLSGEYQHFKGGHYNVIGVAALLAVPALPDNAPLFQETPEDLVVVYQSLYGDRIYQLAHRPLSMFIEQVEKPELKYSGPRFKLIEATPHPTIARAPAK